MSTSSGWSVPGGQRSLVTWPRGGDSSCGNALHASARMPAVPSQGRRWPHDGRSELRLRGFHRSRTASTATRAPVRRRFPRAAGGIVAGVALAAVAATALVATRHLGSNGEASATGSGKLRSADQIVHGFLHFPASSTPTSRSTPQPARVEARRTTNGEDGTPRPAEGCTANDARLEHRPGSVDPDGADDEHHGGCSSA